MSFSNMILYNSDIELAHAERDSDRTYPAWYLSLIVNHKEKFRLIRQESLEMLSLNCFLTPNNKANQTTSNSVVVKPNKQVF